MHRNPIWLFFIIILMSLCSKGERKAATDDKDDLKKFGDDKILESKRSNATSIFDLPARQSIFMGVQSSLDTKAWKSTHMKRRVPKIKEAIELQQVHSSGSIQLAPLSVKYTSPSVSSQNAPTAGELTISVSKDKSEWHLAARGKIMNVPRKPVNKGQHRTMRAIMGRLIPWNITTENISSTNQNLYFQSYHRHNFLNWFPLLKNRNISDINEVEPFINNSIIPSRIITKRHLHEYGISGHVLRREASAPKVELHTKSFLTSEENGTATNENYQTTLVAHPTTIKPEGEEFVPGMTKSVFITVTSSSLAITLCVAVISLYYVRRRRIRMAMDPERQRLIPFRIYTGIYYNQTGPCF